MPIDKRAYCETELANMREELRLVELRKERCEASVERADIRREQCLIYIEALEEYLEDLP